MTRIHEPGTWWQTHGVHRTCCGLWLRCRLAALSNKESYLGALARDAHCRQSQLQRISGNDLLHLGDYIILGTAVFSSTGLQAPSPRFPDRAHKSLWTSYSLRNPWSDRPPIMGAVFNSIWIPLPTRSFVRLPCSVMLSRQVFKRPRNDVKLKNRGFF
jgi:hypothetical protein